MSVVLYYVFRTTGLLTSPASASLLLSFLLSLGFLLLGFLLGLSLLLVSFLATALEMVRSPAVAMRLPSPSLAAAMVTYAFPPIAVVWMVSMPISRDEKLQIHNKKFFLEFELTYRMYTGRNRNSEGSKSLFSPSC